MHNSTAVHQKCHASQRLPDVILRRSFTSPSTASAVIEGLGMKPAAATWNRTCNLIHSSLTFQAGISCCQRDFTWTSVIL